MNNSLTTIAFSIYSNKGVYALLIGSGLSRQSGIPTGWDIVIDLIKRLAIINKEDCKPTPEEWFKNKYGKDPDYSEILDRLVTTSSERVNLLKSYIEPNEKEPDEGSKQPTEAHKAIAKLIKAGYIKVVITTNFDRLLETALEAEGVHPVVIRHADDIDGALPLAHNPVVILKINGDYLDSRFLNTKVELSEYPEKLKSYLLQIINDFGLISCGWSGKWDTGLSSVIKQSENFRFGNFWTYTGNCESELSELALHRRGKTLQIQNADLFFSELVERIDALSNINDNHPLNAELAVTRLKKYIVKDDGRILVHDLLYNETEAVYEKIQSIKDFNIDAYTQLKPRIEFYEQSLDVLLPLIINGVFWSKPEHEQFFIDIITRISEPNPPSSSYNKVAQWFHYYPTQLLIYAAGITAVKAQKFSLLNTLFNIKIASHYGDNSGKIFLLEKINPMALEMDVSNKIINDILGTAYRIPISSWLNKKIGQYFSQIIYSQSEFNDTYDIFEYLLSLNYLNIVGPYGGLDWAPSGLFNWRNFRRDRDSLFNTFFAKADQEQDNWLPIKMGMFSSSYATYLEIKHRADEFLKTIHH